MRKQIEQLREPSLQCAELIYLELLRIVTQLENKVKEERKKERTSQKKKRKEKGIAEGRRTSRRRKK